MSQLGSELDLRELGVPLADDTIRTLHVDDDRALVEMVSTVLERKSTQIDVIAETSVEAALELLEAEPIDCIISDYEMPGRDGLEFLASVRAEHPDLPFILFTGKGDEEIASEAISAGVTDYLQKTSGTDQYAVLANRVENLAEKYHTEREVYRGFQALESAQEGIGIIDESGEYVYLNRAYADVYGLDRAALVGEHWNELYSETEAERFREEILPTVRKRGTWTGESVGLTAEGEPVPERLALTQLDDGGHVCVVRDISEERRREKRLRRETRFLSTALDAIDALFYVIDADLNYRHWNEQFEETVGYSEREIEALTPMDLFDGSTADRVERKVRRIFDDGEQVSLAAELVTKDGERLPYEFTGIPVEDGDEVIGIVGIGRRRSEPPESG